LILGILIIKVTLNKTIFNYQIIIETKF
jgi:hypothetical protein